MKPNTLKSFALVVVMIVLSACNSTMVAPRALTVNAPGNGSAAKPITLVDSSGKLHYAWQECWPELYDPTKAEKDTYYIARCRVVYRSFVGDHLVAEVDFENADKSVTDPQMVVRSNGEVWIMFQSCFIRTANVSLCNMQVAVVPSGYTDGEVVVRNVSDIDRGEWHINAESYKIRLMSNDQVVVFYTDSENGFNRYRSLTPSFSETSYFIDNTSDNQTGGFQQIFAVDINPFTSKALALIQGYSKKVDSCTYELKLYTQPSASRNFEFSQQILTIIPDSFYCPIFDVGQTTIQNNILYVSFEYAYYKKINDSVEGLSESYLLKFNLSTGVADAIKLPALNATLDPWALSHRRFTLINGNPVYLLLAHNKNSLSTADDLFYLDEQNKLTQLTQLTSDNKFIDGQLIRTANDNGVKRPVLAWRECRHTDAGGQIHICDVSAWSPGMQVQKIYTATYSTNADLGTDLYFNGDKLSAIWTDPDAQNTRNVPYVTYNEFKIDYNKKVFLPITLMPQ